MRQLIVPLFLILIAGSVFFTFIDPVYKETNQMKVKISRLDEALNRSREIAKLRDSLNQRRNAIPANDLDFLQKLLPNHVDNVDLVLEIDRIALQNGVLLEDTTVSGETRAENTLGPDEGSIGTIEMNIRVIGPYDAFRRFVMDIERSMRISDIVSMGFTADDKDLSHYSVTARTYWLK